MTRLAPFYDLVCTRAVDRIDHRLAFDVGGERDSGKIHQAQWDRLAAQCEIRKQFLRGLIEETAASLSEQLQPVRETFEKRFGPYPALQRIDPVVRKQCSRALQK